ncbi:MAG TPA: terminase [Hyphomicrobiaceae bacterium]|jgi:hypothetical protein|nr:terminase [Hyphomicrobiaceae bacterium]
MTRIGTRKKRLTSGLYRIIDEGGRSIPFVMNDVQASMMRAVWYWNLILKGRQHGISTLIVLLMLDTALFYPNTQCGLVDATLTDAEKKLDKAKHAYASLPPEFRRASPLRKENNTELEFYNGSSISVGTSHRGGTLQILHVSELGKIAATAPKRSREIRTGAFGTVHAGNTVFVESTAEGAAGDFYDLADAAMKAQAAGKSPTPLDFKLIFLPWQMRRQYRLSPDGVVIHKELGEYFADMAARYGIRLDDEQKAWYAVQRAKLGPDMMWREYPSYPEEAFKVSLEGAVFRREMTRLREKRRIGVVEHDQALPVNTFWDIAKGPNTAIWFHQNNGSNMHHLIDYYENSGEGVQHYRRYLEELAREKGYTYRKHYGPHDLDNSNWTLPGQKKVKDVAFELGLPFEVVPRVSNKADAIEAARNFLSMCWIDEENCAQGIRCLDNYSWVWDDVNGRYKDEPAHNWASHGADALQTGACGFAPDYVPPPSDRYAKPRTGGSAWAA